MAERRKTGGGTDRRSKNGRRKKAKINDPFAIPPNPLGFQFLAERRPARASQFGAILPSIIAKYGLGRKLSVERFHEAWDAALEKVFGVEENEFSSDTLGEEGSSRLETFRKYARPATFRGGVLRVEVVSNLLAGELQYSTPELLAELRRLLPHEKIERLKIAVR